MCQIFSKGQSFYVVCKDNLIFFFTTNKSNFIYLFAIFFTPLLAMMMLLKVDEWLKTCHEGFYSYILLKWKSVSLTNTVECSHFSNKKIPSCSAICLSSQMESIVTDNPMIKYSLTANSKYTLTVNFKYKLTVNSKYSLW
jgi:hypothetical protein